MEANVNTVYVAKDHTLDWEFVDLTKKMNYTDQSIHVDSSKSEILRQRAAYREKDRAGDHQRQISNCSCKLY